MYKTGEIYSIIEEFEKITSGRFDKEEKEMWKDGNYYQDGELNKLFKMYFMGYSSGKCVERMGLY